MKNCLQYFIPVSLWLISLSAFADIRYDIVISGGRVIDPETGLDQNQNVGIVGDRIVEISQQPLDGYRSIDATGLVVSPGFIDLHVHGQSNTAHEYQAHDGVTTALELESGIPGLRQWIDSKNNTAMVNFGATVSHGAARAGAMDRYAAKIPRYVEIRKLYGNDSAEVARFFRDELSSSGYESLNAAQINTMNQLIMEELKAGGLGIGLPVGYMPGATHDEIFRLFKGAAEKSAPIFVHVRMPGIVGIQEVISDAATTGAPLHIVHINSMALGNIKLAIDMVEGAQALGLDVTTEMYPYTAASTSLESALFDEGWQDRMAISYNDLQWQETSERLSRKTFKKYRKQGGVVIIHMMREEWIASGIGRTSTMVASDGMQYSPGAHPRTAGTFARVLGRYVREQKALSLRQAINKMTLMPARRLEIIAPSMSRKGRIQVGADADVTIFDPDTVIDTATFKDDLSFSRGIHYVLVNGVLVIDNGKTVGGAFPGKAVLGKYRQ